jgi:hypothetical protein
MTCAHGRSSAASARVISSNSAALVIKSGIVDLTGDDRATIFGALLWMADRLKSDQGEQARELWAAKGKQAFKSDSATDMGTDRTASAVHR